jgi:hypothetical protein
MAKENKELQSNVNGGEAVEQFFEEKGKASKNNISNGGEEAKISLTNKRLVRFIADTKYISKGHTQEVSDSVYEIYNKLGVIELV